MSFSTRDEARILWRKNIQGINREKVHQDADTGEGYLKTTFL